MSKTKTETVQRTWKDIADALRSEVKEVNGQLHLPEEQYYVQGVADGLERTTIDHVVGFNARYAAGAVSAIGRTAQDMFAAGAVEGASIEGKADLGCDHSVEVVYSKDKVVTPPGGEARSVHGHTSVKVSGGAKFIKSARTELKAAAQQLWGPQEPEQN